MRERFLFSNVTEFNLCVRVFVRKKMETLQTQIITVGTEVKTFHVELSELKRTFQSLEITRQSVHTEVA